MSHRRAGAGRALHDNEQVMAQVWHGFVDTVRRLPTYDTSSGGVKASDEERLKDLTAAKSEKSTVDDALDKINVLLALRRGTSQAPSDVGTPTATLGPTGSRKGRRPSLSSALPSVSPGPMSHPLATTPSQESAMSPNPFAGPRDWARQRREALLDQLPLSPGRKVAFKQPPVKGQEEDADEWILASIKRCLHGDKTKYEVQDIDMPENVWSSSIRSIIPLPDPDAPVNSSAHPSKLEDFPRDTTVLALYPDTTTFYRATVISAPLPGTGMGLGVRGANGRADPGAKRDKYRVKFEDDGEKVHEVDKYFVVLGPQ